MSEFVNNLHVFLFQEYAEKLFKDAPLRKWQQEAVRQLDAQNSTEILWITGSKYGDGRSWLGMWLKINRNATLIMGSQRSAYGLKIQEYIAVDIQRSTCRIQYSFIKRLRNMGKKIIVLATKNPDKKKLLPNNVTITKL